jgi:hypothetical protein
MRSNNLSANKKEAGESKADYCPIVEALPIIIEELRDRGYKLVTVPELLDVPAYKDGRSDGL